MTTRAKPPTIGPKPRKAPQTAGPTRKPRKSIVGHSRALPEQATLIRAAARDAALWARQTHNPVDGRCVLLREPQTMANARAYASAFNAAWKRHRTGRSLFVRASAERCSVLGPIVHVRFGVRRRGPLA